MGFSLLFLLCRELSLVWANHLPDVRQSLPPPHIFLEPTFPVQLWAQATIDCVGAFSSEKYLLLREELGKPSRILKTVEPQWEGRVGRFLLNPVREETAGVYSCVYIFHEFYSKNSENLTVIVRALPDTPFLSVSPTSEPTLRQSLTFHCNSTLKLDRFLLYHGSVEEGRPFIQPKPQDAAVGKGVFSIREVHKPQLGEYLCLGYSSLYPYLWSNISNVVLITLSAAPSALAPWPSLIPVALTVAASGEWPA